MQVALALRGLWGRRHEKLSVIEWHKLIKVSSHVEIINEENAHHFLRYQEYCSRCIHSTRPTNRPTDRTHYVEMLKWLREVVRRKRAELLSNDWIFHHDSAPANNALSSSFWPKVDYQNGTPTIFP